MSSRASRIQRDRHTHAPLFVVIALIFTFFGICVAGAVGVVKLFDSWLEDLPDYTDVDAFALAEPTKIYAADGTTLLAELYLENRSPVTYDQVSPYAFEATVSIEDERFYEHNGVDFQGIARAIVVNITSGSTEGASTITQQLIRNTILLDEMTDITLERKVREQYLALQLEKIYSKDQILMMYMNTINYGDGAYGIQAASRNYFSKDASALTLSESALLAGIPQSPTRLNPFKNYEAAMARRDIVLERMLKNGYINQAEYDAAIAEVIVLNKEERANNGIYQQPYFVDYVKSLLYKNYSSEEIFKGGLTVYTTLDLRLQAAAEDACYDTLKGEAEDLDISLCSVDPDTGFIVAMFGGKDYYSDQYNLATQAHRQCGSSFKAFTLTTAVEAGMSPSTLFNGSSPMQITPVWEVSNAGNGQYPSISLESATHLSLNTVYAQLIHQLGASRVVEMAHRMGITSDLEEVDSITLGSNGVTTLEMASAFGTLATGGIHRDTVAITKVLDRNDDVLYEYSDTSSQVISPEVACAVTSVLRGDITVGTATRASLASGQMAAGKTGTTQNYRDGYFVGYTPQLSTAVWVGTRTERTVYFNGGLLYGGTACCPAWKAFMDVALEGAALESFPVAAAPSYTLANTSPIAPVEKKEPTINIIYQYSDTVPKDGIISETSSEDGTVVTRIVSLGAKPDAKVNIIYQYSDTVPKGEIISETTSEDGKTITRIISLGPKKPGDPDPVDPGN